MGILTHYYTVYGVYVKSYDDELSEELYGEGDLYKLFEDGTLPKDFGLIMDDDHMVFGKILFDSGDLRWNDFKDTFVEIEVDFVEIEEDALAEHKAQYIEQFMNYFPSFGYYMDHEWKLMTFMHLS